jgi:hypothetical protein
MRADEYERGAMNVRPANAGPAVRLKDTFSLCGVEIEVGATEEVAALIGSRLRFFRSPGTRPASVVFDIRAGAADGFAAAPDGSGRPVYDMPYGQLMYFEELDQLFTEYPGHLRMFCSPATGLVQSAVLGDGPGRVLAAYPFFVIPLIEAMKRKGRFSLHAGCVAREGRGVLLAGMSGSGKSTLTAALVADGWDFLTDDMAFVARQGRAISAWGLSGTIDCSDDTAGMLAELRHLAGRPMLAGRDKHPVDVERAFGILPVRECRPHALVLPTISGERRSVLKTVTASSALRELAPNVLLTRNADAQAHLDMLAELVREVPCYSMATGTDLLFASRCLQEVLG